MNFHISFELTVTKKVNLPSSVILSELYATHLIVNDILKKLK